MFYNKVVLFKVSKSKHQFYTMKTTYKNLLKEIETKESRFECLDESYVIEFSDNMIFYLHDKMKFLRTQTRSYGFENDDEEIYFFKEVKPKVQSLLIFYGHVYNLETSCPNISESERQKAHYKNYLTKFSENNRSVYNFNSFYQYYKAKRNDRDSYFFTMKGNNDSAYANAKSFFVVDFCFTTFYDSLLALIIAEEKLSNYVSERLAMNEVSSVLNENRLDWKASKASLVELIYALYASNSISKTSIRNIASSFEELFNIKLGDIHHTYHRMKYRSDSRTLFLDKLKKSLEVHLETNEA